MLDQAFLVFRAVDLPDLLEADAEFRRLAVGIEGKFRDQLLGQAAARAFGEQGVFAEQFHAARVRRLVRAILGDADRKSTRLNSSHANISYAVFCLKKK